MGPLNIIIPLGGVGSRFAAEGYVRPKPLIRVLGKEMIFWVLDSLSLDKDDQVIIVYLPAFLGVDFERIVLEKYPTVRFIQLKEQTRGAAETVMHGLSVLSRSIINRPLMLIDGDAFYSVDVVAQFRKVSEKAGAVFCFRAPHSRPIFSYVTRGKGDMISDIKEKEMISQWANCGTYCFQDGKVLMKYIEDMLSRNETQKGEFYTSGVIKIMLEAGRPFKALEVDPNRDFHVLGTPIQVEEFCQSWPVQAPKRWCFDLDNTLVTHPKVAGDYSTCEPIPHMIRVVRELHKAGHTIIIHTARRMRTHHGNVPAVVADIGAVTLNSLKQFKIPYHEVCFGKPYAHFYVDDLAVDPLMTSQTVAKQTGYHTTYIKTTQATKATEVTQQPSPVTACQPKPWYCSHEVGLVVFTGLMGASFAAGMMFARRAHQ